MSLTCPFQTHVCESHSTIEHMFTNAVCQKRKALVRTVSFYSAKTADGIISTGADSPKQRLKNYNFHDFAVHLPTNIKFRLGFTMILFFKNFLK